jgi:hypothetical protein
MTKFYCLRFQTPPTWRARSPYLYPPGIGLSSYIPRHWVPFSSPPTTHRATVEVFESASTRRLLVLVIKTLYGSHRKHLFNYCVFSRCRGSNVSSELFPSNGFALLPVYTAVTWQWVSMSQYHKC